MNKQYKPGYEIVYPNNDEITNSVNHPSHYNQGDIECIDAIKAAVTGLPPYESFVIGNAIKYIWRYKYKNNPAEDLNKAIWYIEKAIEENDR